MRLSRVLERERVLGRRGSVKLGLGWIGREEKKKSLSDEEIVRGEGLEGGGLVKYAKQARKCNEGSKGRGKFDKVRLE